MAKYSVFFKNEWQGDYTATSASMALQAWQKEYQCKVEQVFADHGAWPVVKRAS